MSAPDPETVNVRVPFAPAATAYVPFMPEFPTSAFCQPLASEGGPVMLAPLNVAVAACAAVWLLTASPAYTVAIIVIVASPTFVHETPSADIEPVMLDPTRTSLTHAGAAPAAPTPALFPPAIARD
jgi:hypothetical protein